MRIRSFEQEALAMRRFPTVLAAASAVSAVAVVAVGASPQTDGRSGRALETLTVSNTNPKPVRSTTALQASHAYRITVSGTVSDWCPASAKQASDCGGVPLAVGQGVDALYCYAKWRCPKPELWRQLRISGQGLDEIANFAGKIPYSPTHRYAVVVHGLSVVPGLSFVAADAVGSASDNSGSFQVTIEDLGLSSRPSGPSPPVGTPGKTARVVSLNGSAVARQIGGSKTVYLSPGVGVPLGFEIVTQYDSLVVIDLPNGARLTIDRNTHIRLQKDGRVQVAVEGGAYYEENLRPGAEYQTRYTLGSPSVVTAVMGTKYRVTLDPLTKATVVSVLSGRVKVTPTNPSLRPVELRTGQEVQVTRTTESAVAPIGYAGAPPGAIARSRALGLVDAIVRRNRQACRLTIQGFSAQAAAEGWVVSVRTSRGWARWTIPAAQAVPADALATAIGRGCPGSAGGGETVSTPDQAIALVRTILDTKASACALTWTRIDASGRPGSWTVTVQVETARGSGPAVWTITGATAKSANALATAIEGGCR